MKGPKGMASFLPFLPDKSKNIEHIAPIIKDNNVFKSVFFNPNIKPNAALSFMSPPPMPPLDTSAIIIKIIPAPIKLDILSKSNRGVLYIKYVTALLIIVEINIKSTNSSGII